MFALAKIGSVLLLSKLQIRKKKKKKILTGTYLSIARISRITNTCVGSVGISARSIHTAAVRVGDTFVYIYERVMTANVAYGKHSKCILSFTCVSNF